MLERLTYDVMKQMATFFWKVTLIAFSGRYWSSMNLNWPTKVMIMKLLVKFFVVRFQKEPPEVLYEIWLPKYFSLS